MAEFSGFWTTGASVGDQQTGGYTQVHWAQALRILGATLGFEGVSPDYLNNLACTANGANTVAVNTGCGLADGKWYENSASVNVNIPSAVGGGNTRIDRIVLRCSWAGFTVRITRIAGTDAASPTAPATTQTAGTTYDIKLCQVLVNTTGTVTVTDERTFAQANTQSIEDSAVTAAKLASNAVTTVKILDSNVTTAKIADLGVTTAKVNDLAVTSGKLAADAVIAGKIADGAVDVTASLVDDIVDDTKVGNRVPQFYRRQGGNTSNWSTIGTTTYTPTAVRMQGGAGDLTFSSGDISLVNVITFPIAFSNAPLVLVTLRGGSETDVIKIFVSATTATTCDVTVRRTATGTSPSYAFNWLAIGPE